VSSVGSRMPQCGSEVSQGQVKRFESQPGEEHGGQLVQRAARHGRGGGGLPLITCRWVNTCIWLANSDCIWDTNGLAADADQNHAVLICRMLCLYAACCACMPHVVLICRMLCCTQRHLTVQNCCRHVTSQAPV
jgi:hypothetical protein